MIPVSCLISSDLKKETVIKYLEALKNAAGLDSKNLLFMIDLDESFRHSIEAVFNEPRIRACQFHVAQAIMRWHGVKLTRGNDLSL